MRDEIYVRIEQRPTMPPLLAGALVIGVIMGVGMAFKFVVDNGPVILTFVVPPLVVWFAYGRRQYRRGAVIRAVLVTLAVPCVILGGFKVLEWHDAESSAASNAAAVNSRVGVSCRAQFVDRKPLPTAQDYRFDQCARYLTRQQGIDLCKPWILRGGRLPAGWYQCARFADAVVPLP